MPDQVLLRVLSSEASTGKRKAAFPSSGGLSAQSRSAAGPPPLDSLAQVWSRPHPPWNHTHRRALDTPLQQPVFVLHKATKQTTRLGNPARFKSQNHETSVCRRWERLVFIDRPVSTCPALGGRFRAACRHFQSPSNLPDDGYRWDA